MQFKNPEILYALLLLIIPIMVHLFQFRRYEKVHFTNVQRLKNIRLQTRRGSQIKKWLTLVTRLLILACAVLAFAQPFQSAKNQYFTEHETVIYLDNSFSMQARGSNGTLLNTAIQDLISNIDEDDHISIFTNDQSFQNASINTIRNNLIELSYSPTQLTYDAVIQKGRLTFSKNKRSQKNFMLISDFQKKEAAFPVLTDTTMSYQLVQLHPKTLNNVSIDSLYISESNLETLELTVQLRNQGDPINILSVALFRDDQLMAKSAVSIKDKAETVFSIPRDKKFKGEISIADPNLTYDNTLYFSLNPNNQIKTLALSESESGTKFLEKLYTDDEFDLTLFNSKNINYNNIADQQLIILNELKTIPNALITALTSFIKEGGHALIIPSTDVDKISYNQLFKNLQLPIYTSFISSQKRITKINFSHPLLSSVFDKKVENFQYPEVGSFYKLAQPPNLSILEFEDNTSFLFGSNNVYAFSSPISEGNSNFTKSPLIVPILYNIGKQSLKSDRLYYNIGQKHPIDIKATLFQDDILKLRKGEKTLIPQQQSFRTKVEIFTDESPSTAGTYEVTKNDSTLKYLSYNDDRRESQLSYMNLSRHKNGINNSSVGSALEEIKSTANVNELWKWFVIFALAFLVIEMLILKFFK